MVTCEGSCRLSLPLKNIFKCSHCDRFLCTKCQISHYKEAFVKDQAARGKIKL